MVNGNVEMKSKFIIVFLLISIVANATQNAVDTLSQINLPLLTIETANGEMPECEYIEHPDGCWGFSVRNATKVPGRLQISQMGETLYDSGEYVKNGSGVTVKIRGNTSAYFSEKKPYKIKLQQKADLLLRGNDFLFSDKEWLLIKDINLKYMTGFKVNELLGLPWTPACRYVNVVINGEYMGVYLLTEAVSPNSNCRINVDETGYIFEYDAYWWNEPVFVNCEIISKPMHYTFKYPDSDDLNSSQLNYFSQMIHQVEQSILSGKYPDYIDVESFARWMIGHDIVGNSDGGGANYILTKQDNTGNSKIAMACLWDFDGNYRNEDKWDGCHNSFYFSLLFNNQNPDFINRYKAVYEELSATIFDDIINYLKDFAVTDEASALSTSIAIDNQKYGTEYLDVSGSVDLAENWFFKRQIWLNDSIPAIPVTYLNASDIKYDAPNIYSCGRDIVVENATGEIYVYDTMGRLVARDVIYQARYQVTVNDIGIYVVKVGGEANLVVIN